MNRHRRRAAKAAARSKMAVLPDLPLMQVRLTKENAPDKQITFAPIGLRDYFAACAFEYANRQDIDDAVFEKIAHILQVELAERLRREIYEIIIGTTLMIVRGKHSQRALLQLFEKIKRDPVQAKIESTGDAFAEFVIGTIEDQVAQTKLPTRDVIDWNIESVRETVPRGRPDEEARSIFFEAVVDLAQQCKIEMRLPQRDSSRGAAVTPLFELAALMRDLVIDYGAGMLSEGQQLPRRFDGLAELSRETLIRHLETAKRTISREKSTISIKSAKSPI